MFDFFECLFEAFYARSHTEKRKEITENVAVGHSLLKRARAS